MIDKASNITVNDLVEYLRLIEPTEAERSMLETMLNVAKDYILKYTGQDDIDAHSDFVIATFVLTQEFWDNRTLYTEGTDVSKVIESILSLHSVNLLPTEEDDD